MNEAGTTFADGPSGPGTRSAAAFLEAGDLHKRYRVGDRTVEVLCGVDLAIGRGEFVALRGASGAGKSTLLHLLGGLDVPDAGWIRVAGTMLTGMGASALARFRNRRVGFIFQAYHLLPDLTALENVVMPARLARMRAAEARHRALDLLERVGLGHRVGHRPAELSGGEQQRVAIARCLVNEPELILADEPTGNLDSHSGAEVLQLLLSLREERGATLVIATHDAAVAGRARRCLQVTDGRLEATINGD